MRPGALFSYSNPHKALYGVAPPRRTICTAFGGAPCTELFVSIAINTLRPQRRTAAEIPATDTVAAGRLPPPLGSHQYTRQWVVAVALGL